MSIAGFNEFCSAICKPLGIALPSLSAVEGIPPAFGFTLRDVSIGILQASLDDDAHAVLMVDYGLVRAKDPATALRLLLETNFLAAGVGTPAFSINPSNDHVVWQMGFAVSRIDPVQLCGSLERVVDGVHQWRQGHLLSGDEPLAPVTSDALRRIA